MWRSFRRWQGITLIAAALVSTIWLAVTNQLILYIHPRYIVFTVIMAALGLILAIASAAHKSDHDHDPEPTRVGKALSAAATVLTLVLAVGLIVVPPATLTTATADQRVINSTGVGAGTKSVAAVSSASQGAFAKFTVQDWASLLRQTTDASFYRDKPAHIVGFITKDTDDPQNVFYLTRFVITCCAVDAQPIGVPVFMPNWQNSFTADGWVRATGSFETNPSSNSKQPIALVPTDTVKVKQPSEPYLY
ncbi:TIGR03943 family protein [Glaciihabitans sp. INWT7]|uniref:TIGR03943 family putative permease subunit n=1 Tax=Glaciihabitans sp. INWT7 TaxID=2596912 RepID=UPI001627EB78|nr:TIGR03943 family protein [Glaciihabitans sp. INWT7]QNE46170.1 TIGR03943 family protein [Glaciihabitans sp. INWT7]